jgi:hypothetical protein
LKAERALQIGTGLILLAIGTLVYITCRPETLRLFGWADRLGLGHFVKSTRENFSSLGPLLPPWFINSAPFALWVASYVLIVRSIWSGTQGFARTAWLLAIPFIAVIAELGQMISLVPGTFDFFDLVFVISATIIALHISPKT